MQTMEAVCYRLNATSPAASKQRRKHTALQTGKIIKRLIPSHLQFNAEPVTTNPALILPYLWFAAQQQILKHNLNPNSDDKQLRQHTC